MNTCLLLPLPNPLSRLPRLAADQHPGALRAQTPSGCPPQPQSQLQVQDYKYEIERLQREMNDVKRKYYDQRRAGYVAEQAQRVGVGASGSGAAGGPAAGGAPAASLPALKQQQGGSRAGSPEDRGDLIPAALSSAAITTASLPASQIQVGSLAASPSAAAMPALAALMASPSPSRPQLQKVPSAASSAKASPAAPLSLSVGTF